MTSIIIIVFENSNILIDIYTQSLVMDEYKPVNHYFDRGTSYCVLIQHQHATHHLLIICFVTLNTSTERRKLLNKNTQLRVDTHIIGTKKDAFKLELKHRFAALE